MSLLYPEYSMIVVSKMWDALRDGAQDILKELYSKTEFTVILEVSKIDCFVLFRSIYNNLHN